MHGSSSMTQGIKVDVVSDYIPSRSNPLNSEFFFVYRVTITNAGQEPARLVSRHWIITNSEGDEEHVRGPGVVGETPYLEPGDVFTYTSACPLTSPVGAMRGTYQMIRDNGWMFDAEIAAFTLAMPYAIN